MKFILDKDKLTIVNNKPYTYNSGSVDYYEAEVQFDETWNDLTIEAIITKMGENKGISRSPINNKLMLDMQEFGTYTIGFVGYKIENEEKIYQISTDLGVIQYNQGAGEIETENEPIPTATEWEIYIAQIQDMIDNIEDMDITAEKIGKQTTITITKKDGTIQEVVINDGQNGQDGVDGKDAKINGKNSIEIEAGNNITIDDTENGIRINSIGTSNYNDLSNKPKINNVELSGNKSLNDLGIQPKGNYLISETDPTVPSYVKNITQTNITNWNNKSDFSGSYNDLSNKPKIPDELKDLTDDSTHRTVTDTEKTTWNNKAEVSDIPDVSSFITKDVNNLTNYTLKTNTGSLIDLEINDTTYVVTLKLKNQDGTVISTDTIDLPLESVVVSGRYDNTTKKVILTLENGSEVDFSVADLVTGLQTEITSQNKLASDLIDDSNSGNKFVTTSEKQTWNNKYDKSNGGIPKTDLASDVQTSLGKADTALQEHQDISGKEDKTNKVTSIDNTSTDTQYPSAKCVHDSQEEQNTEIEKLQTENVRLKATLPTTTGEGEDVTLDKTAELDFVKPPLPRGNTKQNTTTGKNLLPPLDSGSLNGLTFTTNSNGITTISGTTTSVTNYFKNVNKILPAGTYTLSINLSYTPPASSSQLILQDINNVRLATINLWKITSKTFTLSADTEIKNYYLFSNSGIQHNGTISIQLEKGSATSYEPYTGGQPSPSPDYPQEIRNVTGNVEVTISNNDNSESKTLPVSLGNIELCKLGNYQDYLYKNNGNWYVHKNIIKIDLSTITNYIHTSGWRNPTSFVVDNIFNHEYSGYTTVASLFCNRLIADTPARITGSVINAIGLGRNSSIYISVEGITTSNALITYFSQNPTYLYAPLATPTDTEVTDTTLISQLEEISKTLSYQGQTNITSNTIALFNVEAYQSTKLILEERDAKYESLEARVALLE